MSVRLFLVERWMPRVWRRWMFSALVRTTAGAFDVAPPDIRGLSMDEAVAVFARFTRREVERVQGLSGPVCPAGGGAMTASCSAGAADGNGPRHRLYLGARRMGTAARRAAGIRTRGEATRALRLLYAAIGIDLDADPRSGELTVSRCAFSGTYTPEVCAFISALDAGLADGITGGAALAFTARMTEGAPCCRARLCWRSSP